MTGQVRLVFRGETLDGFDDQDVVRWVGEKLALDETKRRHLFSGRRVVLKKAVDDDKARHYVEQFARLGARLHIESLDAPAVITAPAAPAATIARTTPTATPEPPTTLSLLPIPTEAPADEGTIVCPKCGDEQPRAVFCRACSTNMPIGIAAKAEDEARARAEHEAARKAGRGRVARPRAGTTSKQPAAAFAAEAPSIFGLGFQGRIARRPYAAASAVSLLVFYGLVWFVLSRPGVGRLLIVVPPAILLAVFGLRLCGLRCHDCNLSGWWSLLLAVPVLGILASLVLAVLPGSRGDNRFGEPPDTGNPLLLSAVTMAAALAIGLGLRPALSALGDNGAPRHPAGGADAGERYAPALSGEAARVFREHYLPARGPKAFAASPAGAWGWRSGANTNLAESALADCESRRELYTAACELIDAEAE